MDAVETTNVVKGIDRWTQAAVQTEDLVLDQRGQREVIEEIGEVLPDVRVAVLAEAFVVEAVDLCNLAGFVVATENGDALWVADFERDKKCHRLDGVVATVNVVACGSNESDRPPWKSFHQS